MVCVKFFKQKFGLEEFYLKGPAMLSGLSEINGEIFANKVIKNLEDLRIDCLDFSDLIKYSSGFLEGDIQKRYLILNNYLLNSYKREVEEPFFIFLGGAASSGKDLLVSDFQHCLGSLGGDRAISVDFLRENARTELLKKYGSIEKVPVENLPLFQALYRLDEQGIESQINFIKKQVLNLFIKPALRECKIWMHPFYILFGTQVIPDFEDCVKGDNKLLIILNPSDSALSSRIYSRQERERGLAEGDEIKKRQEECKNTLKIKNYIFELAKQKGSAIISLDNREEVLHKFGEHLIGKLEKILMRKRNDLK